MPRKLAAMNWISDYGRLWTAGAGLMALAAADLRAAEPALVETTVFKNVADGYPVFRIPAVVRANDGTLLAFCEGRAGMSDGGNIDIVLKRSSDHGKTWGPLILVHDEGGDAAITIGNPAPVVDRETGDIHLLFCRNNARVFHSVSKDNGLTWSPRTELTDAVKLAGWGWYATGPVHGIQLKQGAQAGRLVVPANHRIGGAGSDAGPFGAQVLYSDDKGATWHMDAVFEGTAAVAPNETTLAELSPQAGGGSRLYINSRDYGSTPGNRSEAWSADGGTSYSTPYQGNPHFVTPVCQGSLLHYSTTADGDAKDRMLFSSPNGGSRTNGAIWISTDEAATWSQPKPLRGGAYAYSDLVRTGDDHLGVLFETGGSTDQYNTIDFLRATEEWLDAPPPKAENPGAAFWNLEETAPGETVSTAAGAIKDVSPAELGLDLTATTGFAAVAGAPEFGTGRALSFAGNGGLGITDASSENRFDYGADDSFTIEVVCRMPANSTQLGSLVAKDLGPTSPSWWLRVENGRVRFLISDNTSERFFSSAASINDGGWHHVAAVRDAGAKKLRLFIDGQPSGEIADTTTGSLANSQTLWIGRFNSGGRFFTGDIDFVRITPAALTPENFAGANTQSDADGDKIPDKFEREKTGALDILGPGDADGDGAPDVLEFAMAADPVSPGAISIGLTRTQNAVIADTFQRLLPAWLDLRLSSSTNLTDWSDAGATVTLTALDEETFRRTDRIDFPLGVPDRLFLRYGVTAVR